MKRFFKVLTLGTALMSASFVHAAQVKVETDCSSGECITTETSTFVLNLWAPDEVAPPRRNTPKRVMPISTCITRMKWRLAKPTALNL